MTILARDPDGSRAFYDLVLPHLGFSKHGKDIWRNALGLHIQLRGAKRETREYERYGPGLNHFGFTAPDAAFVEALAAMVSEAGHVARLQRFPDGTMAVFLPDPDGLRIEVSWYPPGVPPVE
nr:VOC family protein [Novosphingobium taihuense]